MALILGTLFPDFCRADASKFDSPKRCPDARFPFDEINGRLIFFRQSRRRGKFLGLRIALQNACQKENERILARPFLLCLFSPGDKIENCAAQLLAMEVRRLRQHAAS
jgi:hypothetical protein